MVLPVMVYYSLAEVKVYPMTMTTSYQMLVLALSDVLNAMNLVEVELNVPRLMMKYSKLKAILQQEELSDDDS